MKTELSDRAQAEAVQRPAGWVSVGQRLPDDYDKVDIWMSWGASALTMGMGDDFRVPEAYRRSGKWFHSDRMQEKELNSEYITHWRPMPLSPAEEAAQSEVGSARGVEAPTGA